MLDAKASSKSASLEPFAEKASMKPLWDTVDKPLLTSTPLRFVVGMKAQISEPSFKVNYARCRQ